MISYMISCMIVYDIIPDIIFYDIINIDIMYDIIYLYSDCIRLCFLTATEVPQAQPADSIDNGHDNDREMDFDDERDFADQGPLSDMDMEEDAQILATLLKHIPSCMNADDIEHLLQDIPDQPPVVVPARTVQEAIDAGDLPPLDRDAANVFTESKRILQEHVLKHGTNSHELKDLIQRVLHQPDFNADEVDHDMHERLMRAVEDSDIEVIDMWEEGDGLQDNTFVKHKASKVLMELIADERMAGRQHFGFKLSTDAKGDRVLGCDANGSLSFELALLSVGPGTVPISIVLYIDATYIKHWIPIRPIYSEFLVIL